MGRLQTVVTRQLTYQSFICEINALNWFTGRFGWGGSTAAGPGHVMWGVIKAEVRAKSRWYCLLAPLKRKIEYKAGQQIWHLHKFNYLCYLAKTWGRTEHLRNLWVLQIFARYYRCTTNLKYSFFHDEGRKFVMTESCQLEKLCVILSVIYVSVRLMIFSVWTNFLF